MNKSSSRRLSKFYSRKFIISVTAFVLATGCLRSNPEAVLTTIKSCEARLDSALKKFEQKERLEEALEVGKRLFEQSASADYRQGLGWYWILQADLAPIGITQKKPAAVMAFADTALQLLLPIKNWPGVARAYAARAQADKNF